MKVSLNYSEWEEGQGRPYEVRFFSGRVFEYTAETIKQQFTANGGHDFDALIKLPCLFTYEGLDVAASIGRINEVILDGGRCQITYTLPNVYPKAR